MRSPPRVDDQLDPCALRVDDGDAVLGREELVAAELGNTPHHPLRERLQAYAARNGGTLAERAQGQRAAAIDVDALHHDHALRLGEREHMASALGHARNLSRRLDHLDDLVGAGIDDADAVVDDHVAIGTVLRHQRDDRSGEQGKPHRPRNPRPHVDREVRAGGPIDVALLENGIVHARTLLLGQLHATACAWFGLCTLGAHFSLPGLGTLRARPSRLVLGIALPGLLLLRLRAAFRALLLLGPRRALGCWLLAFRASRTLGRRLLRRLALRARLAAPGLLGLALAASWLGGLRRGRGLLVG